MGDRGTFKPNDSVESHSADSQSIITRIVNASVEALKYLPEKDAYVNSGVFVELDFKTLMTGLEHIRESLEAWADICREEEEENFKLKQALESVTGNCPYRDTFCDIYDCVECDYTKMETLARFHRELERVILLKNQLEKELNEKKSILNALYGKCANEAVNDPANFCGNCAHYAQMGKDDDEFEGICVQHYIKRVDPDDASCKHFKSNQAERDKPEQPCCDACNRDDCSKCTLCPF